MCHEVQTRHSIPTISFRTPKQVAWHDSIVRMLTRQSISSAFAGIFIGIIGGTLAAVVTHAVTLSCDHDPCGLRALHDPFQMKVSMDGVRLHGCAGHWIPQGEVRG